MEQQVSAFQLSGRLKYTNEATGKRKGALGMSRDLFGPSALLEDLKCMLSLRMYQGHPDASEQTICAFGTLLSPLISSNARQWRWPVGDACRLDLTPSYLRDNWASLGRLSSAGVLSTKCPRRVGKRGGGVRLTTDRLGTRPSGRTIHPVC